MLQRTPVRRAIALPLGKELSRSIYQITDYVGRNPFKSFGAFVATCGACLYYDARFVHENRVTSPYIANHLEYSTYDNSDAGPRGGASSSPAADAEAGSDGDGGSAITTVNKKPKSKVILDLEDEIAREESPFRKREMEKALSLLNHQDEAASSSTMLVTARQLEAREPHWTTRSNERNWSIMARDQQKQHDKYQYRFDRSRDDDFGRNSR